MVSLMARAFCEYLGLMDRPTDKALGVRFPANEPSPQRNTLTPFASFEPLCEPIGN